MGHEGKRQKRVMERKDGRRREGKGTKEKGRRGVRKGGEGRKHTTSLRLET